MSDQKLSRYLAYSLGAHGALFFVLLLQALVFPSHALLLQPTIHVDLVALPDQVKTQDTSVDTSLPVSDKAPLPQETPKAKDEPPPVVKAQKSPEEISRDAKKALKNLKSEVEKLREAKREAQIEQEKERIKALEEKSRRALRGNQVNKGTSASGVMEETLNAYAGHVTERLRSNWALPTWLQSRNLRAVVRIYINQQGQIVNFSFRQGSGNEAFDNYVKAAVERSNPFAPPPAEMARQLQSGGMEVSFPL